MCCPHYQSILNPCNAMTAIFIGILLLAIVILLKLNVVKGWFGEKITSAGMWALLDKNEYRRIDDVIVPHSSGTTQIDHVIVSIYGIFVIETKNIKGWIFGSPESDKWTQSIYGNKNQFQNPLKQNYRHVQCLAEYIGLDIGYFKPVVFFIGDCKFKTPMPSNVLNSGLISYIKDFDNVCLTPQQVSDIEAQLIALKTDKSLTKQGHLASLRERHESGTTCPKCGRLLVQRIAKKGDTKGKPFLGCSGYPKCKFTRPL
jgi:restriction system protein